MAKTTQRRHWIWIGLALVVLAAVVVFLDKVENTVDVARKDTPPPPPIVSVVTADRDTAQAQISAFAQVRPRWNADLRTAVTGRILTVHPAALAGTRVEKGTPLFSIEKTQYETAVATAQMQLEEARLNLLQAQNNVTVARRQFSRDGSKPPNDLALKLPQLRIAERTLTSAQTQLQAAERELKQTEITAPFAGIVTDRMASLGQTINAGEPLLHLSDTEQFEMIAQISRENWVMLNHPLAGQTVQLLDRSGTPVGTARIRDGGGFLDPTTRQTRIYLEMQRADGDLLAGDFLRVTFQGRDITDTLTLPETALTRAGHIWLVSDDNLLQRITPDLLFRMDTQITIKAPDGPGPWRVAKTPLASFLPDQRVTPQE